MVQVVKFQGGFAKAANAPTEIRLLNHATPVVIGLDPNDNSYQELCQLLDTSNPSGGTPLCKHIHEITQQIKMIAGQLRENDHKVSVIICTDGESSDGDIAAALRPLYHLPVWVVVRLCTDEENITMYWNHVDSQIEVGLEILDDLVSEAEEVHAKNPWFTYGSTLLNHYP